MNAYAFMVMPFGRKPTMTDPGKGPADVDFNALWDKAFYPMLVELGYQPIRADQEADALIIHQMLERLYFSDLVLVDITTPNGNVYYEMGVRHAAKRHGCVLLAAEWSKPLFDAAQMRLLRYPLPAGELTEDMATAIRTKIGPQIAAARMGMSPVYEVLPGYPSNVDASRATGVRDQVAALAAFQGQLRSVRAAPNSQRLDRVKQLELQHRTNLGVPGIALGLLRLLVDSVKEAGWQHVLDYIDMLDPLMAREGYVQEQRALALGKLGRSEEAVAQLEALIELDGATSEREGLIGGRYRELLRVAKKENRHEEAAHYLNCAIQHYERGMVLDLNDYYPSSNLARLYRERNAPGDEARAQRALHITSAACERAIQRGTVDEWVRPTMLGVQFDLPDAGKAHELVHIVLQEGRRAWKLDTTISSLEESLELVNDLTTRDQLQAVLDTLRSVT